MSTETPPEVNPFAPPAASLDRPPEHAVEAEPIGGWLVLVGLGLIATAIGLSIGVYRDIVWASGPKGQAVLAGQGGVVAPVAIAAAIEVAMLLYVLAVLWFFVRRSRRTPALYIGLHVANVLTTVLTDGLLRMWSEGQPHWLGLVRPIVPALIWIPYFLKSKRVRETFVH